TDAGKATSSLNSLTHGLCSQFQVLLHENQGDFDALAEAIQKEFQPAGDHENFLINQMIQARWRLLRIDRLENLAFDQMILGDEAEPSTPDAKILAALSKNSRDPLALLQRYRTAAERAYYKAHRELTQNRRANEKFQQKAMDNYIKEVVFPPIATDPPKATGFASQRSSHKGMQVSKVSGNLALRL